MIVILQSPANVDALEKVIGGGCNIVHLSQSERQAQNATKRVSDWLLIPHCSRVGDGPSAIPTSPRKERQIRPGGDLESIGRRFIATGGTATNEFVWLWLLWRRRRLVTMWH